MQTLTAKVGIITGSAQGIGAACALEFAKQGAAVLVADINIEGAKAVADNINTQGGRALAMKVDLTVEAHVLAMIATCVDQLGGLSFLVQNAAAQIEKPLHETTTDDWDLLHAINLRALFWGTKHTIPHMMAGGGGTIINMASVLSLSADPLLAAYSVMKHGVLGLTKATAANRQYASAGIRCNCICPGDVQTPMQQRYLDSLSDSADAAAEVTQHYPVGRIGLPSDIASCAVFLASDQSAFINGAAIVIDGGLTALVY